MSTDTTIAKNLNAEARTLAWQDFREAHRAEWDAYYAEGRALAPDDATSQQRADHGKQHANRRLRDAHPGDFEGRQTTWLRTLQQTTGYVDGRTTDDARARAQAVGRVYGGQAARAAAARRRERQATR